MLFNEVILEETQIKAYEDIKLLIEDRELSFDEILTAMNESYPTIDDDTLYMMIETAIEEVEG